MKKTFVKALCASATLLALAACTDKAGWGLEGTVTDAPDTTLYIETASFNEWRLLDSVRTDSEGRFSYDAGEAAGAPSIYRVRLANKYIYFAVDSAETVTLNTKAATFGTRYSLSGNPVSEGMARVDSLVYASVNAHGAEGALRDKELKTTLNRIVNQDSTCLLSYYVVGKFVGSAPLYDMTDRADIRVLGNAANNYIRYRPDDARAKELETRWHAARRALGIEGAREVQMEASLTKRPAVELKRYDVNGRQHDFNAIVDRGRPTVLNLTFYGGEDSQANNMALKGVYDAYNAAGLKIYQVAYDPDEMTWKRSAANLPWIAVYNSNTDPLDLLVAYNADPLRGGSVSFVFNSNGELVERVSDPSRLAAAVAKVM